MLIGAFFEMTYLAPLQAMTMMGLFDTAYWLSWISWEALLIFFSSTLIVIFGMMFQFDFFLRNNVIVVGLLFFLFQLTMVRLNHTPKVFTKTQTFDNAKVV